MQLSLVFVPLLLLSATWTASARDCRQEDVHFEMMTGYVYSAPGEIMVTSPGVLLLRDCLEQCRRNDTCHAINFETGLCVLFANSYTDQPGRFYVGAEFSEFEKVLRFALQILTHKIFQYQVFCIFCCDRRFPLKFTPYWTIT
jgi:hypothetical protein